MHYLIAIITAIAGFFWALHSLQNAGVDLNAFNPFTWMRRRKWERQYGTKPMHALTDTMEAAALLTVSIAKEHGEITRETKLEILKLFEGEFGIKRSKSIELFSASSYMLQGVLDMAGEVRHVLEPSKDKFEENHIAKLLDMLHAVSKLEQEPVEGQIKIIEAVSKEFNLNQEKAKNW